MKAVPVVVLAGLLAAAATLASGPDMDEPIRETFSLEAADSYLAESSRHWVSTYNCVSCHTNGLYLLSGAMEPAGEPWRKTRSFALEYLDRYINDELSPTGQYGATEGLVATACFLALGDSVSFGTFTAETRVALDHALSLQDEAGHWSDWLACNWPPYESDLHFGVTLMALTLGRAPADYLALDHVQAARLKLHTWLETNPPATLHQKGMLLWADAEQGYSLAPSDRSKWINEFRAIQRDDGGWCMASLGNWPRRDDSDQLDASEAYPTAFSLWVLARCGIEAGDPALDRGMAWLRANQRESGRWFSRSQRADTRHYLSHAATNMATMALRAGAKRPVRQPLPRQGGSEDGTSPGPNDQGHSR